MTTRSRKIALVSLCALALCALLGVIVYVSSSKEPSYQGKPLSEWIIPFCRATPAGLVVPGGPVAFNELQPVRLAIAAMGTNALPYLTARLRHRESPVHRTLRQLANKQSLGQFRLADPSVERTRVIRALAILGPAAHQCIPDLARDLTDPSVSQHASYALAAIGEDGVRVLLDGLTNRSAVVRMESAAAFVFYVPMIADVSASYSTNQKANPISAELMAAGLSRIVQDSSSPHRIPALQRLGLLGPAASNAVPNLLLLLADTSPMRSVVRHGIVRALANIKNQPQLVVPALTNLLNDPDLGLRMAAANALRQFGYQATPQASMPPRYSPLPQSFKPATNLFDANERPPLRTNSP